tara:strand:+ start:407 stop:919 length:513 start_codon:yes stop_codon:yes gene_type:complete
MPSTQAILMNMCKFEDKNPGLLADLRKKKIENAGIVKVQLKTELWEQHGNIRNSVGLARASSSMKIENNSSAASAVSAKESAAQHLPITSIELCGNTKLVGDGVGGKVQCFDRKRMNIFSACEGVCTSRNSMAKIVDAEESVQTAQCTNISVSCCAKALSDYTVVLSESK